MSAAILSKLPMWLLRLLRVTKWQMSTQGQTYVWRRFSPETGAWETKAMTDDEAADAHMFWASAP